MSIDDAAETWINMSDAAGVKVPRRGAALGELEGEERVSAA